MSHGSSGIKFFEFLEAGSIYRRIFDTYFANGEGFVKDFKVRLTNLQFFSLLKSISCSRMELKNFLQLIKLFCLVLISKLILI